MAISISTLKKLDDRDVLSSRFYQACHANDARSNQVGSKAKISTKNWRDVDTGFSLAKFMGISLFVPCGATLQSIQRAIDAIVVDIREHLNKVESHDSQTGFAIIRQKLVQGCLKTQLIPNGLWYPQNIPTISCARLGARTDQRWT